MAIVDIIKCFALFYKFVAAPKDFIHKEKFRIKLSRSLHKLQASSVSIGLFIDIVRLNFIHIIVIFIRLTLLQFCHSLTTYNSAKGM